MATAKELKRIKRITAARRRAGEQVFTDDEIEKANLERPPPEAASAHAKPPRPQKLSSPTSGYIDLVGSQDGELSPFAPTPKEVRQWMDMMYLEPTANHLALSPNASMDSTTDSSGSWMLVGGCGAMPRAPSGSSC